MELSKKAVEMIKCNYEKKPRSKQSHEWRFHFLPIHIKKLFRPESFPKRMIFRRKEDEH